MESKNQFPEDVFPNLPISRDPISASSPTGGPFPLSKIFFALLTTSLVIVRVRPIKCSFACEG